MESEKKTVRTIRGLREYTCLGCPLTRSRTNWCFRLCAPDEEGNGRCGRIAPHGLKGRTQQSIEDYSRGRIEEHCEKLERFYLASPCNEFFDPGVRVREGEAEIVIPVQEKFLLAAGSVHASLCFAAMADAAALAVNSRVEKVLVTAVDFDVHLARPVASGELMAQSRVLETSGDHYLAESILHNAEGEEIAQGRGAFIESETLLTPEIGYA